MLLIKNITLQKSSKEKSISLLASKASWHFSIILLVTNKPWINSAAARHSSMASHHIFFVLYPSEQNISIKYFRKHLC